MILLVVGFVKWRGKKVDQKRTGPLLIYKSGLETRQEFAGAAHISAVLVTESGD